MKKANHQQNVPIELNVANIEWTDNGQPRSAAFEDVYFSRLNGVEETHYAFIEQNHLLTRWSQSERHHFTIAETGFGTGLNFLCAANLWLNHPSNTPANSTLHFVSAEKYPLSKQDLHRSLLLWPELSALAEELLDSYPPPIPGIHRLKLANGRVILTLLYGDATEMFGTLKRSNHPLFSKSENVTVDAWFLDGFTPAKNPDMWTEELFRNIADLSGPGTTFSTFTAAGIVKRGLKAVGFSVTKTPGFGDKWDMLRGEITAESIVLSAASPTASPTTKQSTLGFEASSVNSQYTPPWYLNPKPTKPSSVIVIGGGIAGCSTARALAERNIDVTLIERHSQLAQEGSGNPQGIIYPKLSNKSSPLTRFGLASLLYASRYHRDHLHKTGVLLLPPADAASSKTDYPKTKSTETYNELFLELGKLYPDSLVRFISEQELEQTAGVSIAKNCGLFFPNLGWVNPPQICQALINHPNIHVIKSEINSLEQTNENVWQAIDNNGDIVASAESTVIACGVASDKFHQTSHLPLKQIRGQISSLPATEQSGQLKTVICGEGYIAPAIDGTHTLGASYNIGETSTVLSESDHQTNLQHLQNTDSDLPKLFGNIDTRSLAGRAAFRCTTPDYLPVAGPAPVLDDYLNDYKLLRKNARSHIPIAGSHWPGLYLNCGHGSRGMSYAPLCAELIASQICGEMPPLELDLRQAIHPGRFIIRNLKRNKI